MKFIKAAKAQLRVIQRFLRSYSNEIPDIFSYFPQELKDKLDYADISDSDYAYFWQKIPFNPKKLADDVPFHVTAKGEL